MTNYMYPFLDQVYAEPEVLIPFSLFDKVVLAGDNMQVNMIGCHGSCYGNKVFVVAWLL